MIDVIVFDARGRRVSRVEADDPEHAVFVARTLLDDAVTGSVGVGRPTATFLVDGRAVRTDVTRIDLR